MKTFQKIMKVCIFILVFFLGILGCAGAINEGTSGSGVGIAMLSIFIGYYLFFIKKNKDE